MNEQEIEHGKRLALDALFFRIARQDAEDVTVGEVRQAIRLLFGPEVDAALQREFAGESN